MTRWFLEGCLDETKKSRKTPLSKFPFRIGRSKSIDMVVLRTGISRQHAEIYKHEDKLFIRDLGSTNGTYVDNKKVETELELKHHCLINFAHVESRLIDTEYREPDDEPVTVVMTLEEMQIKLKEEAEQNELQAPSSIAEKAQEAKKSPPQEQSKPSPTNENIEEDLKGLLDDEPKEDSGTDRSSSKSTSQPHSISQSSSEKNIFVQGRWDQSNRRKHNRREGHWHAHLTLKNNDIIDCTTRDVSEEGVAILSPVNLKESTLVKVEIDVFYKGRSKQIVSLGVVRHSTMAKEGFTLGILFKKSTKESSEFLSNYSNHRI